MKRGALLVVGLFLMSMLGCGVVPVAAATTPGSWGCFTIGDVMVEGTYEAKLTSGQVDSYPHTVSYWADFVDAEGLDYDGEGVYIAVLDTGLRSNWESYFDENRIATEYGKGFSHDMWWDDDEGFVIGDLQDDRGFITKDIGHGHGSHVTSTILGYRLGSYWIEGIAPMVTIIPVLVLDTWLVECPEWATSDEWATYGPFGGYMRVNGGSYEMVEAGIRYVTDLATNELSGSKVIISMSLGGPEPSPDCEDAIDDAIDAGVIVVASAGNEGDWGMGWPGAYSQVISVAAAGWTNFLSTYPWWDVPEDLHSEDYWGNDWQLMLMGWSSRPNKDLGQKNSDLDVTAPGWYILGPYQLQTWWNGEEWLIHTDAYHENYYWWTSGTSMAASHVSAIVALVQQWSQDEDGGDGVDIMQKHMEKILRNAATNNWPPASYDSAVYSSSTLTWDRWDWGKGFLQADEALEAAEEYVEENF